MQSIDAIVKFKQENKIISFFVFVCVVANFNQVAEILHQANAREEEKTNDVSYILKIIPFTFLVNEHRRQNVDKFKFSTEGGQERSIVHIETIHMKFV